MPTCKKCLAEKQTSEFSKASRNLTGVQSYCKTCAKDYHKEYKQKYPEKATNAHYKRSFGLSLSDVKLLLENQNNKCALCDIELSMLKGRGFSTIAHVDHCHETNKVRGILCGNCNTALGKLGDSVESIERVLKYVKGGLSGT